MGHRGERGSRGTLKGLVMLLTGKKMMVTGLVRQKRDSLFVMVRIASDLPRRFAKWNLWTTE